MPSSWLSLTQPNLKLRSVYELIAITADICFPSSVYLRQRETGFLQLSQLINLATFLYLLWRLLFSVWISPIVAYLKLKRNGFGGPTPSFPLGNLKEMKEISRRASSSASSSSASFNVSHDIHSIVSPHFAKWQRSHGKVFIYWLGTEPFLYIADPEFLKTMSTGVMGKKWGKPNVFRHDREPCLAMSSLMAESTNKMLERWTKLTGSGNPEIDVEKEIITTAGEIIGRTSFGLRYEDGSKIFHKLRAMQMTLFKSTRFAGVPFGKFLCPHETLEAKKLGKEIDSLLLSIITSRKNSTDSKNGYLREDLLGLLIKENDVDGQQGKALTSRELVDECKTFFFGGHETTALALSWTLLLLAMHPEWQSQLRDEIREVSGDKEIDFTMLARLKKMGWVMNEALRLYPPSPNAQRQAREDIKVGKLTIPKGTNIWIDLVAMHRDPDLWGEDAYEFKPERFKDDLHGGCKHKMGYMPFGFGGRMCIGRNLSAMEYKVVLTLILSKFSFSLSPSYSHSPWIMLSLRPCCGLPLIVQPL